MRYSGHCHRTHWINLEEESYLPRYLRDTCFAACPWPEFRPGVSEFHGVTRHLPFSLKPFASWHWCPSHDYVDRSLNLDARCRFDSTARTKQPKLRFLFTHEVFTHLFLPTRFFLRTQNPESSIWGASDIGPVISESQLANIE